MSNVVINWKKTDTVYEAERGNVKLEFTHNSTDGTISGPFYKTDVEGNATEHLGQGYAYTTGVTQVSLTRQTGAFITDFKTCVDLLNDAINHINNLPE